MPCTSRWRPGGCFEAGMRVLHSRWTPPPRPCRPSIPGSPNSDHNLPWGLDSSFGRHPACPHPHEITMGGILGSCGRRFPLIPDGRAGAPARRALSDVFGRSRRLAGI